MNLSVIIIHETLNVNNLRSFSTKEVVFLCNTSLPEYNTLFKDVSYNLSSTTTKVKHHLKYDILI